MAALVVTANDNRECAGGRRGGLIDAVEQYSEFAAFTEVTYHTTTDVPSRAGDENSHRIHQGSAVFCVQLAPLDDITSSSQTTAALNDVKQARVRALEQVGLDNLPHPA